MKSVLHLVAALGNHVQVLEVQVLQLLEQVHLLVQVDYGCLLALDVALHHWDAAFALLELVLDRGCLV